MARQPARAVGWGGVIGWGLLERREPPGTARQWWSEGRGVGEGWGARARLRSLTVPVLVSKVDGGGWIWREERQGQRWPPTLHQPLLPPERSARESSWVGPIRWGRLVFLVKWRPVPDAHGRLSSKSHRFVCFAQVSEKTYVFGSENHSWGLELFRETSCSSGWGRIPKC